MVYALATIVAILISVGVILIVPFFLQWLAEENVFFTTVKEGTVKTIMRGKQFERHIMAFTGYHLNDPKKEKPWYDEDSQDWEVLYHGKDDHFYDDRPALLKHLGLYWVGWPWAHSVYVYQFEWNETHTNVDGKERVLRRAEATDMIYVSDFTYAIVTEGAETSDRLPTDELTLITVAIRNPYRALFSGEDWMQRVTAAINRHVREFVGKKEFEKLVTASDSAEFSEPIIKLTQTLPGDDPNVLPNGLKDRYGVVIRTADLQTVELSGEGDMKRRSEEATTKQYVAKQEAAAVIAAGEAAAQVIVMTGNATAESLQRRLDVIKNAGPSGPLLAQLDAMQESSKGAGNTVIWANNPLIEKKGETES